VAARHRLTLERLRCQIKSVQVRGGWGLSGVGGWGWGRGWWGRVAGGKVAVGWSWFWGLVRRMTSSYVVVCVSSC